MEDRVYLLIKVTIKTSFKDIHNAIRELQRDTEYHIGSTEHVEVLKTEIMELKTK
jgi:hypothetical protein